MFTSFKKKSKACTRDDARFLFLLLLGREPFSGAELEQLVALSFFGAAKRMLLSPNFTQTVIDPFMLGKRPMQLRFAATQANFIAKKAKTHFSVKLSETNAFGWPQCLQACLGAERAQRAFLRAFSADRLQYVLDQLDTLAPHTPPLAASFLQTLGTVIEGKLEKPEASQNLTLEFYLNGIAAGTTQTFRDKYSSALIFSKKIEWPGDIPKPYDAMLSIYEQSSGVMICPPKEVILDLAAASQLLARAVTAIEAEEASGGSAQDIGKRAWMTTVDRISDLPFQDYDLYRRLYQPPLVELDGSPIKIGVLLIGDTTADARTTHQSLTRQTYLNYDVIQNFTADVAAEYDLLLPLPSGATLHPRALALLANFAAKPDNADVFRFGHDYVRDGQHHSPMFVATFDPLILEQLSGYATSFAVRADALSSADDFSHPKALWQRLYQEKGNQAFSHIPDILLSIHGDAQSLSTVPLSLPKADHTKKLAIVIPTKDRLDLLTNCVRSLQETIQHRVSTEIIIVDNGSVEPATQNWLQQMEQASENEVPARVIKDDRPFNWAALNNLASSHSGADLLLFLNNDTEAVDTGWDEHLRQLLARSDTGVVGAKLLYQDRSIQHAGALLYQNGKIRHEAVGYTADDPGYAHRLTLTRTCEAVTGAFLACSREHFEALGGFDAERFAVTYNDIDFCLRTTEAGRRVIFSPALRFLHLESQSRGDDRTGENKGREMQERDLLLQKWSHRQLKDAWLPPQIAYKPGAQEIILKRARKALE